MSLFGIAFTITRATGTDEHWNGVRVAWPAEYRRPWLSDSYDAALAYALTIFGGRSHWGTKSDTMQEMRVQVVPERVAWKLVKQRTEYYSGRLKIENSQYILKDATKPTFEQLGILLAEMREREERAEAARVERRNAFNPVKRIRQEFHPDLQPTAFPKEFPTAFPKEPAPAKFQPTEDEPYQRERVF